MANATGHAGRGAGGRVGSPPRAPGRPTALAFDAEGRLVAHDLQGIRIWPAQPISTRTRPIVEHPLPPMAARPWPPPLARTPGGRIMVLVRSANVFLWRAETPDRVISVIPPAPAIATVEPPPGTAPRRTASNGTDGTPRRFRAAQIAPDGSRLYLIEQGGMLRVWSLQGDAGESSIQARELNWTLPVAETSFNNIALRPDGAVLALAERNERITLVDTNRSTVLGRIPPPTGETEAFQLAMAFSPDGRQLAVGSQQGTIALWSVAQPSSPRRRFTMPGHHGIVAGLVFDAQGRRLASTGMDPLVEVWDLELIQRELADLGLSD